MIPREKELKELFESEDKAIEFLHAHKILPEIQFCRIDGAPLSKISDFKFKCRKSDCRKIYSSLTDTIFSRLRLKFSDFFRIAYFWIAKVNFSSIVLITGHSSHTIKRVLNLINDVMIKNLNKTEIKIGGPGIQVQLDESKFGKRKYNRGRRIEGVWVFGGVEKTPQRKFFAVCVDRRDSETLNELILRYVLPGSIVITDGWKGYNLFKKISILHII